MNEDVGYFDHFIEEGESIQQEQAMQSVQSGMLSQDQFRETFIGMHGIGSAMTGIKALALPNNNINADLANEVADTIYETILDVPMFHFILQPGNKWLGRGFVMIAYVQGMRTAIAQEKGVKPKAKFEDVKKASKTPSEAAKGNMSQEDLNNLFNGGDNG